MKVKNNFSLKNIAGNYVVIAVGAEVANFNGMISLNETGAFLWEALKCHKTRDELVTMLLSEYEGAEEAELASDVDDFIETLRQVNVIEE